ncbi:MAG: HEAT repeat domain-containing protein [Myxococcota bacterium]
MTDVETNGGAHALVAALADGLHRKAAFEKLVELGPSARDAVRAGLIDGRWEVRRWCALWFWRVAHAGEVTVLVPLLRDPKSKVRQTAILAIAQARGEQVEVIPLLLERALGDESLHVRRQAVLHLAWDRAHPDLEGFFAELLAAETDVKLRKYAAAGLARCRAVTRPC